MLYTRTRSILGAAGGLSMLLGIGGAATWFARRRRHVRFMKGVVPRRSTRPAGHAPATHRERTIKFTTHTERAEIFKFQSRRRKDNRAEAQTTEAGESSPVPFRIGWVPSWGKAAQERAPSPPASDASEETALMVTAAAVEDMLADARESHATVIASRTSAILSRASTRPGKETALMMTAAAVEDMLADARESHPSARARAFSSAAAQLPSRASTPCGEETALMMTAAAVEDMLSDARQSHPSVDLLDGGTMDGRTAPSYLERAHQRWSCPEPEDQLVEEEEDEDDELDDDGAGSSWSGMLLGSRAKKTKPRARAAYARAPGTAPQAARAAWVVGDDVEIGGEYYL